mgnify:FL=1
MAEAGGQSRKGVASMVKITIEIGPKAVQSIIVIATLLVLSAIR